MKIRNEFVSLSFFLLLIAVIMGCNKIKRSNVGNLPNKFPLKPGNTWIYKNLVYSNLDTICTYDTLCIIGKYKDYFKYTNGYSRISLVNNKSGKLLSYGYIQLSDTIHGSINKGDTFSFREPKIIESDTILFEKPTIMAIFNIDTGYVEVDTIGKYILPNGIDSFHVSIIKDYQLQDNKYDTYVYRHISSCPSVYCRYEYYTSIGEVYTKAISKNKRDIVQEIILEKFIDNYYMKNLRISENMKYY